MYISSLKVYSRRRGVTVKEMMGTKADRIRELLDKHDMSVNKLAKEIGVAPNAVHQWLKQDVRPSQENMQAMADVFGVEPTWLDWGTTVLTDEADEHAKKYANLSERDQKVIDSVMDSLSKEDTEKTKGCC